MSNSIRNTVAIGVTAIALPASLLLSSGPADAAGGKNYSNCTALQRDFPAGVARSAKAAQKQVRDGNSRPATTKRAKKVYFANRSDLDRDKDGTACET